jgi:hypothetical protein
MVIVVSVVFGLSCILAFLIFVYPIFSFRGMCSPTKYFVRDLTPTALLYLYILIGIVTVFGLSVYIAAIGWQTEFQDDLCLEVMHFTLFRPFLGTTSHESRFFAPSFSSDQIIVRY